MWEWVDRKRGFGQWADEEREDHISKRVTNNTLELEMLMLQL